MPKITLSLIGFKEPSLGYYNIIKSLHKYIFLFSLTLCIRITSSRPINVSGQQRTHPSLPQVYIRP